MDKTYPGVQSILPDTYGTEDPEKLRETAKKAAGDARFVLRIKYWHADMLCTVIDVDFQHEVIRIENKTDNILLRAFGVLLQPSWQDFEYFLESRCFPRTRAGMKDILRDLGLTNYDPLAIIEKTQGRMAEDQHWMELIYL